MHTCRFLSRVQFAIHRKRLIHPSEYFRNRFVQSHLYRLCKYCGLRSVCPSSCTSFPPSSHALQLGKIDVVSQHASAQRTVLEYKASYGRFCAQHSRFVSVLDICWCSGKKGIVPALHPFLFCCASSPLPKHSWYLDLVFGIHAKS